MATVKTIMDLSLYWIPLAGLEPTFHCFPKDVIPKHGAALNRSDSLLNECIDNDVQKCRIIYTSQYKSFASEVTQSLFLYM